MDEEKGGIFVKSKVTVILMTMAMMVLGIQCAFAASAKPNVKILATGGTIAGSAASATATTGYKAGALGIDVLINAVP